MPTPQQPGPTYLWYHFTQLSSSQLYDVMRVRQEVFVVEQNCPYLDADGCDSEAWHLLALAADPPGSTLIGYLRFLPPGLHGDTPAIGRLLTIPVARGHGVAHDMMRHAMQFASEQYPGVNLSISAQLYLQHFYTRLGFTQASSPYDEDGIPHIKMVFAPPQ